MKKCFKKLGSFVIVLTFVVGMLMTDAGAEDLASVSVLETIEGTVKAPALAEAGIQKSSIKKMSSDFSIATVKTYEALNNYISLDHVEHFQSFGSDEDIQGAFVRFESPKTGNMVIQVVSVSGNANTVQVAQRESDGTYMNGISNGLRPGYVVTSCIPVEANTEYMLYFSSISAGDIYKVRAAVVPGGKSGTLSTSSNTGKFAIGAGTNINHNKYTTYWKMKAKKNGRLNVYVQDIFTDSQKAKITLCNSKKKAISSAITIGNYEDVMGRASFGIAGDSDGRVYYVKVQTAAPIYAIGYKFNSFTTKAGTKKSKATTLSKGKTKSVTLAASTSTGDQWYKFKVSKNKSFRINFSGNVAPDSSVKIYLLKSDGKTKVKLNQNGKKVSALTLKGKVNGSNTAYISGKVSKASTFYIKVSKASKASSAAYKISYKK